MIWSVLREAQERSIEPARGTLVPEHIGLVEVLEALLFVADAPASLATLAAATGTTQGQVEQALEILQTRLESRGGLRVVHCGGGFQLATRPELAEVVAAFLDAAPLRLSRAHLEALAIVAYHQPVTLAEIESVRGVQSEHVVRSLMDANLIRKTGSKPIPGRPFLYGTTDEFLRRFGLNGLDQLAPSSEESSPLLDRSTAQRANESIETPAIALFMERDAPSTASELAAAGAGRETS
jgi:segregation and condensation protein B